MTYLTNVNVGRTPVHVEAVEAAVQVQVPDREEVPRTMHGGTRAPSGKSQKLPGGRDVVT